MNACAYCCQPLPKGKKKYCCPLHERLWWYRIYEEELAKPGRRPNIPGAWDYVRNAAIGAAGHKCQRCGKDTKAIEDDIRARMQGEPEWKISGTINSHTYFEVHHRIPLYQGGNSQLDNLVVLCTGCHKEAHREIRTSSKLKQKNQQMLFSTPAGVTA